MRVEKIIFVKEKGDSFRQRYRSRKLGQTGGKMNSPNLGTVQRI